MPDGFGMYFKRISEGTGYADALYEHTATATPFLHSEFQWNGNGWDLRFREGASMVFPENYAGTRSNQGAPTEMRDGRGHAIRFERDRDRNLEQITSPNGRFIQFEHDARSRVTKVTGNDGSVVRYGYDAGGRLASVTSADHALQYHYAGIDLVAIENASRPILRVHQDDGRRVSRLDLADGRSFRFIYPTGGHETLVEAPDGSQAHVRLPAQE